jgi:Fe-S-cluster-containing dehydrogenase component
MRWRRFLWYSQRRTVWVVMPVRSHASRNTGVIEKSSDFIPVYCHHCAKAPCKDACPVEAISRNEQGIVLIDNDLCIGCKECIEACPFGAMQFDDNQEIAVKCDLCVERLADNKQPSCMSVCPTGCIHFGEKKNIAAVFERMS